MNHRHKLRWRCCLHAQPRHSCSWHLDVRNTAWCERVPASPQKVRNYIPQSNITYIFKLSSGKQYGNALHFWLFATTGKSTIAILQLNYLFNRPIFYFMMPPKRSSNWQLHQVLYRSNEVFSTSWVSKQWRQIKCSTTISCQIAAVVNCQPITQSKDCHKLKVANIQTKNTQNKLRNQHHTTLWNIRNNVMHECFVKYTLQLYNFCILVAHNEFCNEIN